MMNVYNLINLNKPSIQALIHRLIRHYYSIAINYRKNELEEKMLLNLHKNKWTDGLILKRFDTHSKTNEQTVHICNHSWTLLNGIICRWYSSLLGQINIWSPQSMNTGFVPIALTRQSQEVKEL